MDFIVFFIYIVIVLGLSGVISFVYAWVNNYRLMMFLKENYPDKYEFLYGYTYGQGYTDPLTNFYFIWNFLNSDDNIDDLFVVEYKAKVRKGIKIGFIIACVIMLFFVLLVLISS